MMSLRDMLKGYVSESESEPEPPTPKPKPKAKPKANPKPKPKQAPVVKAHILELLNSLR
jgi:hypothetical protein